MAAGGGSARHRPLEESPGSTETGRRVMPGEGPFGGTSGKAPQKADRQRAAGRTARVKGCGKSAPRPWQQGWHGKPRPEQGLIGTAHPPLGMQGAFPAQTVRVGRTRRMATCVPDEWSSPGTTGDRTRLTGRLTPVSSRLQIVPVRIIRTRNSWDFACCGNHLLTTGRPESQGDVNHKLRMGNHVLSHEKGRTCVFPPVLPDHCL